MAVKLRKLGNERILPRCTKELRDQLDRTTSSIMLNIAEGSGRWQQRDKKRYYEFARGSAMETAAILSLLHVDGRLDQEDCQEAIELADRITSMLTALLRS